MRGFSGLAMWASGGEGSWELLEAWCGEDMKLWRFRQELIRFPIALWVVPGLVGGVNRAAWSRGCDESQLKADGRSIVDRCAEDNRVSQVSCIVLSSGE